LNELRDSAKYCSVTVAGALLNFLYPPRCASCGARVPAQVGARVCERCARRATESTGTHCSICGGPASAGLREPITCPRCLEARPSYRRAYSITRYRATSDDEPGSVAALIRRHKYGFDQAAGRALAEFIGELPVSRADYDLIVPVPLHLRRLIWRGYNQAAMLADAISQRINLPVESSCLVRVRFTAPQTARSRPQRRRNMSRAFAVRNRERVTGKRILLVDDVMTTGATLDECSRVLMSAGAKVVDAFTLARVM
jgi:ComF family protein